MTIMSGMALDFVLLSLRAIAPYSSLLLLYRVYLVLAGKRQSLFFSMKTHLLRKLFVLWITSEALFFVYCKYLLHFVFQLQPSETKVAKLTRKERKLLMERCLSNVNSPEEFFESWYKCKVQFEHAFSCISNAVFLSHGRVRHRVGCNVFPVGLSIVLSVYSNLYWRY
jgi:hypothetical protein